MSSLEVQRHNQTVLESLEPGDQVEFIRGVYSHWAVYVGDNEVVHLSGDDGARGSDMGHTFTISGVEFGKATVRRDNFWDVVGDSEVHKNNSKDEKLEHFKPSEIVRRALSKIGEVGYNLIFKNCEHFASWCRYNKEQSDQADDLLTGLAVGGALVAAFGIAAWLESGQKKDREKRSEY
ncbi:phospholipase A and acyltransferase 3-like [Haliotis rufescens]|uniref:phospholipase A and acyltransferase 3-like n=1 Tax=Haliotis rufescens TaxID=6454 RepID=UPI00201ECE9F|nr:phospholipase A and acyltransferase 3-like [Haliotis rufescens]